MAERGLVTGKREMDGEEEQKERKRQRGRRNAGARA
jgi:hypothetical protein